MIMCFLTLLIFQQHAHTIILQNTILLTIIIHSTRGLNIPTLPYITTDWFSENTTTRVSLQSH